MLLNGNKKKHEAAISFVRWSPYHRYFRLVSYGDKPYILNCFQVFISFLLFPLSWFFPLRVILLGSNESIDLEKSVPQHSGRRFNRPVVLILAIGIINMIREFRESLSLNPLMAFCSLLAVVFVLLLSFYFKIKKYQGKLISTLRIDSNEDIYVILKPEKKFKAFLIYIIMFLIPLMLSFFAFQTVINNGYLVSIVLLGLFYAFVFLLQTIFAFIPGNYEIREVHK